MTAYLGSRLSCMHDRSDFTCYRYMASVHVIGMNSCMIEMENHTCPPTWPVQYNWVTPTLDDVVRATEASLDQQKRKIHNTTRSEVPYSYNPSPPAAAACRPSVNQTVLLYFLRRHESWAGSRRRVPCCRDGGTVLPPSCTTLWRLRAGRIDVPGSNAHAPAGAALTRPPGASRHWTPPRRSSAAPAACRRTACREGARWSSRWNG